MWKILLRMQKNLTYSIPLTMIVGLAAGFFYDIVFLKFLILPFTFLMVYPMMVNLQFKKVFSSGDLKLQLITILINFGIIPFIAYFLGLMFFNENPLYALGLLLASLLPTSGMTISWTGFARGNINAAIKMTVIGLLVGSLVTPIYASWLLGALVKIPLKSVFFQIMIVIFIPMFFGLITRKAIIKVFGEARYNKELKNKFPVLSTVGVLGIVFVAMALKAKSIILNPSVLLELVIPIFLLYLINFLISTIIGKLLFGRKNAIALVYGTVMRNLSIALAIAVMVFGDKGLDIALVISISYIIQVQSAAWYVKISDKIFGKTGELQAENIVMEGIFSLTINNTIKDSIKLLNEDHIHSIFVIDEKNKITGMLSMNMIIDLLADDISLETRLKDIELKKPIMINQKSAVTEVIKKMKKQHEYKVIIIDDDKKVKGVLTESDILSAV